MTDHPITPNRLREYAETRGDTLEGLRVDELAFLEACAWEWEKAREASAKPAPWDDMEPRLISDAQKALDALGEDTPAAPEKPACEHKRGSGSINTDGSGGFKCFDCPHEVKYPATRTGPEPVPMWATEPPRCEVCGWTLAESRDKGCVAGDCSYRPTEGTEEWYRIKARRDVLKAKPAPSSPAAERADEGLEEEALTYARACWPDRAITFTNEEYEQMLRVTRAARALRRGWVSKALREVTAMHAGQAERRDRVVRVAFEGGYEAGEWLRNLNVLMEEVRNLGSTASVVVDREVYERLCSAAEYRKGIETERDALAAKLAETTDVLRDAEQDRDRARERLADYEDGRRRVLDGVCAGDEKHCSCVPDLRAELKRLRGERDANANARAMMVEVGHALLGCDGHPCRVENGAFTNTDLITEIKRLQARDDAAMALRTAPPTVAVTDVDAAAAEMALRFTDDFTTEPTARADYLAILRKHTRAASVDEIQSAICKALNREPESCSFTSRTAALAALRALGVREAEKNATTFVVDREKMAAAIQRAWDDNVSNPHTTVDEDAADAAITEYERQRAEHEEKAGVAADVDRQTSQTRWERTPTKARDASDSEVQGASNPQRATGQSSVGQSSTPATSPPPAPAQAGWTEEQEEDALYVADIAHYGKLGTPYRSRLVRLNPEHVAPTCEAIARVAPHFHKVRVKLPKSEVRWTVGIVRAALRAAGVEVSDDA